MKFLLFIIVIAVVVFGLMHYYGAELPFEFSLGPSETCDTIKELRDNPVLSETDPSYYNNYTDGLTFFLNLCFFR